ncbi:hypothetical protein GCM10023322_13740 [Rugosimonospora acidiphila]|uniref:HTH tetR-type domain-containing protein n=1 Tax=Rugosimonospora acidiphila TaxID=556531 RepID=A0ABP9RMV2_9ACTN
MARTSGSVADQTRQRIIEVARDLFVERGYQGTSVRDISERLGMTKGSMYYHFASKDELFGALVTPLAEELGAFIAEAGATGRVGPGLLGRLVDLFDRQSGMLGQLLGRPPGTPESGREHLLRIRIPALALALAGRDGPAAMLRGRCALGVIEAGVRSARRNPGPSASGPACPGGRGPAGRAPVGSGPDAAAGAPVRGRLSEADRRYIVDAALAVLSTPAG